MGEDIMVVERWTGVVVEWWESSERKNWKKNYENTLSISVENPIMPLHFNGNYKFVIGVVFVSKIMCLVIISEDIGVVDVETIPYEGIT